MQPEDLKLTDMARIIAGEPRFRQLTRAEEGSFAGAQDGTLICDTYEEESNFWKYSGFVILSNPDGSYSFIGNSGDEMWQIDFGAERVI